MLLFFTITSFNLFVKILSDPLLLDDPRIGLINVHNFQMSHRVIIRNERALGYQRIQKHNFMKICEINNVLMIPKRLKELI